VSAPAPVSVIVPMHDGERHVAEALESIFAQTAPPHEVLVVDDGSTDRGTAIAAGFGERVRVLRQPRRGAAAARNRGIAAATQSYLAFLDHDDVWTAEKTARQLALLERRPDLAGAFGAMVEFVSPDVPPEVAGRIAANARPQPSTLIGCLLLRAAALRRVGPLAEDSQAEFVDWYLRAKDAGLRFETIADLVLRRRIHESNTSRDAGVKRDYLKHLKASLDRRRSGARGA
jgi:glycosyltransferase involved in cell wall biosynthesis